jgi:hypothetical protein
MRNHNLVEGEYCAQHTKSGQAADLSSQSTCCYWLTLAQVRPPSLCESKNIFRTILSRKSCKIGWLGFISAFR